MAEYNINLIRERVLPKRLRHGLFWGMLVYLLLCGACLAFVVHRSARKFVDASKIYREMKVLETQVLCGSPEEDVVAYAERLRPEVVAAADILTGIDVSLQQGIDFVSIMLGLARPLPASCFLINVRLQVDKNMIQFSVLTPAERSSSHTAGEIIDLWTREGGLEMHLGEIQAAASQREFRSGRAVVIHRFKAEIK